MNINNWKQEYKAFDRQELTNIAHARYGSVLQVYLLTDNELRQELIEYDRISIILNKENTS